MAELEPPPKRDPAEFALRARPRPVTRLSRRTLVLATTVLTALLFGALWWALGMRAPKLGGGQELYDTNARPSDAVAAVPGTYAELTKPKPVPPAPTVASNPGPVEPVDLGQPVPQSSSFIPPAPAQPDPSAAQHERERQQAASSAVFFTVSARENAPLPAQEVSTATGSGTPPTATPSDPDGLQNLQDHKRAFMNRKPDTAIYSEHRLETPISPYELTAGWTIPGALITGLDSDLPGEITGQVTENVYDSVTGRYLLIPQGTRIVATYDSEIAFGQERAFPLATRLVLPDGSSIVLDNLPITDIAGYAGLEDGVDFHTWQLIKGIGLSTLLGVSGELASNSGTNGSDRIIVAGRDSADQAANQAGQKITQKQLAQQPTLTERQGLPFRLMVRKDIVLRPYKEQS